MQPTKTEANVSARIIPRSDHNVSRAGISKNALRVLYRLAEAGFQAFLVGGAVRDLLLGIEPKDFDIATDAHPDDVHALFRNSRLIGRRFRLAHVRFGREIIEVATFRAATNSGGDEDEAVGATALDEEGRILRDNVYGTIADDVWRRDFTVNALYYNIADFSVWDYVGGTDDIGARRLRIIGDPHRRLREDPVRMLRAVRFAAKLNFVIDESVETEFDGVRELLGNVPPARLFDEFIKLFQTGHAKKTFELLWKYNLFSMLFPDTDRALESDESGIYGPFVREALTNTDLRAAADRSVTPMFLLGVFLWKPVRDRAVALRADKRMSEAQALAMASTEVVLRQQSRISIPKRFGLPLGEMLAMQPRFEQTSGSRAHSLLEHRRFRAAYDFYVLRAAVGDADPEKARFWTEVQTLSEADRLQRFGITVAAKGRPRRPRRRRAKRADSSS